MDKEKLIKEIMKDLDCSREDAEEIAEMEIKAKEIKRYEKAEEQKPRKKREPKIDAEKCTLIDFFWSAIINSSTVEFESVDVKNLQKEITFKVGENKYSLTLTKHRPPKKIGGLGV